MQKFKVVDNGNPDGTAKDAIVGVQAGTNYKAEVWNDNFFNMFRLVEGEGYTLIDDDLSQLSKSVRSRYNPLITYNTSVVASQTFSDVVMGSDGLYYEAQSDGLIGEDPVSSTPDKWKEYVLNTRPVANRTELKAKNKAYDGQFVIQGDIDVVYKFNASRVKTDDNGGTVIAVDGAELNGCWESPDKGIVYARAFGVKGDELDYTVELQNAINATPQNGTMFFKGKNILSSTITIPRTMSIVSASTSLRQGSTESQNMLIWDGGASSVITSSASDIVFDGFAAENRGSATSFAVLDGQRYTFKNLSFLLAAGTNKFSTAVIEAPDGSLGYSVFSRVYFIAQSNTFIKISSATNTGCTPIHFEDRCIFESTYDGQTYNIVSVDNNDLDGLIFTNCTFNQHGGELTIANNLLGANREIKNLVIDDCEIDGDTISAAHRMIKVENALNICIDNNTINGGGSRTGLFEITDSNVVSFEGNRVNSVAGSMFEDLGGSTVRYGTNFVDESNTSEIVDTIDSVIIPVTYGASTILPIQKAQNSNQINSFKITVTDGSAWTLFKNGSGGVTTQPGHQIRVIVENASGGVMNAGTPFAGYFKTSGAFAAVANGNYIIYEFIWDGANYLETSRSGELS